MKEEVAVSKPVPNCICPKLVGRDGKAAIDPSEQFAERCDAFDAGVRYSGTVPQDMIAQRLSADLRWVVAASPDYLAEHGTPTHPDELKIHRCLGVRLGDGSIYRWEFEGPEGEFDVPIKSAMTADDSRSTLAMALNGAGFTFGLEPLFAKHVLRANCVWC